MSATGSTEEARPSPPEVTESRPEEPMTEPDAVSRPFDAADCPICRTPEDRTRFH